MARKTKASDIDSNFIINAFRRDDMSIPPEARSTPAETVQEASDEKEDMAVIENKENAPHELPKERQTGKEPAKEETERKRKVVKPDYEEAFIHETTVTARQGKQVYIRKEYHDRIQKIIHVIGQNELSISSYLDNVLAHHFSMFVSDITESFNNHLKSYNI